MQIKYLGYTSFYVETENSNVLFDVYKKEFGILYNKYLADIIIYSKESSDLYEYNFDDNKKAKIVNMQGEYEIKNTLIQVFTQLNGNNVSILKDNNLTLMYLGKDLITNGIDKIIETYPNIDILISPIDNKDIDLDKLSEILEQIEPHVFIPMLYKESDINTNLLRSNVSINDFKKHFSNFVEQNIYKLKKSDISENDKNTKVIILNT